MRRCWEQTRSPCQMAKPPNTTPSLITALQRVETHRQATCRRRNAGERRSARERLASGGQPTAAASPAECRRGAPRCLSWLSTGASTSSWRRLRRAHLETTTPSHPEAGRGRGPQVPWGGRSFGPGLRPVRRQGRSSRSLAAHSLARNDAAKPGNVPSELSGDRLGLEAGDPAGGRARRQREHLLCPQPKGVARGIRHLGEVGADTASLPRAQQPRPRDDRPAAQLTAFENRSPAMRSNARQDPARQPRRDCGSSPRATTLTTASRSPNSAQPPAPRPRAWTTARALGCCSARDAGLSSYTPVSVGTKGLEW